jgi:hypothetical protein
LSEKDSKRTRPDWTKTAIRPRWRNRLLGGAQPIGKRDRIIGPYNHFTTVSWQFTENASTYYQCNVRPNRGQPALRIDSRMARLTTASASASVITSTSPFGSERTQQRARCDGMLNTLYADHRARGRPLR